MRAGLQVSLSSSRPFNWGKNLSVQKSSARFFFSFSQQPSHFDTLMGTFLHDRRKEKGKEE